MKRIESLPKTHLISLKDVTEQRAVVLVYSGPAWLAVEDRIHLPIAWRTEVFEAFTENWHEISAGFHGKVIYSVGGGLTADTAKYYAAKFRLPLVVIPTALSVDAFITAASGIRRDGCVYYIDTKPPEDLTLDLQVVAAAPETIRAAGITDAMSIATGSWDWKFAQGLGINKKLPIFITETGWAHNKDEKVNGFLDITAISNRYSGVFNLAWKDERIVAVTPFVLNYQEEPFDIFSWKNKDGSYYEFYETVRNIIKIPGKPIQIAAVDIISLIFPPIIPNKDHLSGIVLIENKGQQIWDKDQIIYAENRGHEIILDPLINNEQIKPNDKTIAVVKVKIDKINNSPPI